MPNQPINRPLPPSVEQAYRRKCSELKRRIAEVEETNDTLRLRKSRMNRAILKMRLERAFLLEQLTKRMEEKLDESDKSTSPPPTPTEKPLRSKRSHRPKSPTSQSIPNAPSTTHASPPLPAHLLPPNPLSSAHTSPDPGRQLQFSAYNPGANGAPLPNQPLEGEPRFVESGFEGRERENGDGSGSRMDEDRPRSGQGEVEMEEAGLGFTAVNR